MLRYTANDDLTMWVGHDSNKDCSGLELGTMNVSAMYTGLPDMEVGANVTHNQSTGTRVQAGVNMNSVDCGVAMDSDMNMSVSNTQNFGDNVEMTNWFRMPVQQMMGGNMSTW